jgi:hypothetical protein
VDRLGVGRLVTASALLVVALCTTMSLSPDLRASDDFVMFSLPAMAFVTSAQTVAGFSLFMRLCSAVVAGTQFTLFMAATNFARVGGAGVVDALSDRGYPMLFGVMAISALVGLPFLYACLGTAPAGGDEPDDETPPPSGVRPGAGLKRAHGQALTVNTVRPLAGRLLARRDVGRRLSCPLLHP